MLPEPSPSDRYHTSGTKTPSARMKWLGRMRGDSDWNAERRDIRCDALPAFGGRETWATSRRPWCLEKPFCTELGASYLLVGRRFLRTDASCSARRPVLATDSSCL